MHYQLSDSFDENRYNFRFFEDEESYHSIFNNLLTYRKEVEGIFGNFFEPNKSPGFTRKPFKIFKSIIKNCSTLSSNEFVTEKTVSKSENFNETNSKPIEDEPDFKIFKDLPTINTNSPKCVKYMLFRHPKLSTCSTDDNSCSKNILLRDANMMTKNNVRMFLFLIKKLNQLLPFKKEGLKFVDLSQKFVADASIKRQKIRLNKNIRQLLEEDDKINNNYTNTKIINYLYSNNEENLDFTEIKGMLELEYQALYNKYMESYEYKKLIFEDNKIYSNDYQTKFQMMSENYISTLTMKQGNLSKKRSRTKIYH